MVGVREKLLPDPIGSTVGTEGLRRRQKNPEGSGRKSSFEAGRNRREREAQ